LALCDDASEQDRALALAAERALDAYLARDFAGAIAHWSAALDVRPGDSVATVMRERAEGYLADPPPERWTGVYFSKAK
jgi:hypothetical protein